MQCCYEQPPTYSTAFLCSWEGLSGQCPTRGLYTLSVLDLFAYCVVGSVKYSWEVRKSGGDLHSPGTSRNQQAQKSWLASTVTTDLLVFFKYIFFRNLYFPC